jgi:hypothetical protein
VNEPAPPPPKPSAHPDRLAAIASGFVAALALAVSTYNVYLQRQQIRAQVWPRLQWSYTNVDGFEYTLANNGVGPAEVEAVEVKVDGKPVADWEEAVRLSTGAARPHVNSFMNGRALSPGAEMHPLHVAAGTDAEAMDAAHERIEIDICYCSSLHDCWQLTGWHRPVALSTACPSPSLPFHQ